MVMNWAAMICGWEKEENRARLLALYREGKQEVAVVRWCGAWLGGGAYQNLHCAGGVGTGQPS